MRRLLRVEGWKGEEGFVEPSLLVYDAIHKLLVNKYNCKIQLCQKTKTEQSLFALRLII